LQEDGAVETLFPEARGERPPGAGVGDDAVDGGFAGVEIGHPGTRGDGDVGARKNLADGADGGNDITASPSQLVARTSTRDMEDGLNGTPFSG